MRDRKYIQIIRNRIIMLSAFLILVCISFSVSYSNFVYESKDHRAVEMFVNKLDYELKINEEYTNTISIKPGNYIVNVNIYSLNEVETKYKLTVNHTKDISVFYIDNRVKGTILPNENIPVRLLISNKGDRLLDVKFSIASGYNTNTFEDIEVLSDYDEISDTLLTGTYVNYLPSNSNNNYVLKSNISGYKKDQTINKKNTKWKLLSVEEDGSINIISETPLTIDNKNSLLYLSGSVGYNNGVYILNDICNKLYGSYNASGRSLNIEDIENKLTDVWSTEEYVNPQTVNNYISYTTNTYTPKQFINNLLRSDSGKLILEDQVEKLESLKINVDFWTHEMLEENFKENYYSLFMNQKYNSWIASRYVNAFDSYALFGLSTIHSNTITGNILYSSIDNIFTNSNAIRPIINISSPIYLSNGVINIK